MYQASPNLNQQKKPNRKTMTHNPDDLLMNINSRFAGLIIGKGGMTIEGLRKKSGAFISILDVGSYGLKTVKISGNQKAKELAQKLVNDIIDANNPEKMREMLREESEQSQPVQSTFDWDALLEDEKERLRKRMAALPPIIKDFYKEHPEVTMMTDQQVKDFRVSKNNIMIKYFDEDNVKPIPKPVLKFSHAFKNYPIILKKIKNQKFETPSPIQCQAWPVIMSGHDLIATAQTGTGKTLAFLLPAFIHIDFQPTPRNERKGPSILVLAPTLELVLQIESEVKKYSYKGIRAMSIYDCASSGKQKECLQNGVEIVIATPGPLFAFVESGAIDLSDVTFLIFDEADRMLDLGFGPQIILSLLTVRPDRQTIMTSATWEPDVKHLIKKYMTNPIQVMIGSLDLTTVNTVKQDILIMEENEKESWLDHFLKNCTEDDKIIIFANQNVTVDCLSVYLFREGHNFECTHGRHEQIHREEVLENLRNGKVNILIATDVVSRGIDFNDITVVINYDVTKEIKEYVHRVGRTGRAGKTGMAITLMTREDWDKAKGLVEVMKKSGQDVPPELQKMAEKKKRKSRKTKKQRVRAEGGYRLCLVDEDLVQ